MKVRVIYGGDSPERSVSLESGPAVVETLENLGWMVEPLLVDDAALAFDLLSREDSPVVIALHGGWGEDGGLQSFLELKGIPFVGSRAKACALAMDKWVSKALFNKAGLLTPAGTLLSAGTEGRHRPGLIQALERHGRLVVKPNCGGNTVATTVVTEAEGLKPALAAVWEQNDDALVEPFIPGRELTVTVWDGPLGPEALPVVEISPCSGFYDFEAKYTDGGSRYDVPADLPEDLTVKVSEAAVEAYKALGCRDYARVDFRLSPEGDAHVLEINTSPGATAHSLVPMAVRARGMTLESFYETLVCRARDRQS